MTDIWVRSNDLKPFEKSGDFTHFNDPHEPMWLKPWHVLTALQPIVMDMAMSVRAEKIGAILITKLPPGGRILPHTDGGWHADYFKTKLYLTINGNEGCINQVESESICMQVGQVWQFDNANLHSVENHGDTDRIVLIVCVKT